MKLPNSTPLTSKFASEFMEDIDEKPLKVIENIIIGNITLEKPSINKISIEQVKGSSKRTFYRHVHDVAEEVPIIHGKLFANLQKDRRVAMKRGGVISLDEHIIPHGSEDIEGVDSFYSTTEDDIMLGHSMLSTHYWSKRVEYPVNFNFYRRKRELEKWDKEDEFQKKNEIARELVQKACTNDSFPSLLLMDSYFMTKDNVLFFKELGLNYISRPKKNWVCTFKHEKYSMAELFYTIEDGEFQETLVRNPKTGGKKVYKTAVRDVFFKKIGTHRVVFVKFSGNESEDGLENDNEVLNVTREEEEPVSGKKFAVFVTDLVSWNASQILSRYSLRWTIETGYRDMSQNLGLHGCKWRELSGHYCFIHLIFICYLFLMWARIHGSLARYGVDFRTLGQMKRVFIHYCQERFSEWLQEIRSTCEWCPVATWIYENLYKEGRDRY